jgi:hypothetical protein
MRYNVAGIMTMKMMAFSFDNKARTKQPIDAMSRINEV